jgi:hypothetical protein
MPAKVRGGGAGSHQDGQHGHVINLSWMLHLPAGYSCMGQGLHTKYLELKIIIL